MKVSLSSLLFGEPGATSLAGQISRRARLILRLRHEWLWRKLANGALVATGERCVGKFVSFKYNTISGWLLEELNKRSSEKMALPLKKGFRVNVLATVLPPNEGDETVKVIFMVSVAGHDDEFFQNVNGASATIGRGNSLLVELPISVLKNEELNGEKLREEIQKGEIDNAIFLRHAPGTTKFFERSMESSGSSGTIKGPEKMNGENISFYAYDTGVSTLVVVCSKNAPFAFYVRNDQRLEDVKAVGAFLSSKQKLQTNEQGALVLCNILATAPNMDDVFHVMTEQHTICELMNPHFVFNGELETSLCVLFARQFDDGPDSVLSGAPIPQERFQEVFVKAGFMFPEEHEFASLEKFLLCPIEGIVPYEDGNPAAKRKTAHYDVLKWLVRELLYALTRKTARNGATNQFTKWLVDEGLLTVDAVLENLERVFEIFQENSKHKFDPTVVEIVRRRWKEYFIPRLQKLLLEVRAGLLTSEVIDQCSVGVLWWIADCDVSGIETTVEIPDGFEFPSNFDEEETIPVPPKPMEIVKGKSTQRPSRGGGAKPN